jgi:hypothetical protein
MPIRRRRSAFRWDTKASRFRRASSGQFLSRKVVIRAYEGALAGTRRTVRAISLQLRNGEITVRQWQREVAVALKDAHVYSAALARGGQLSQADFGRVGRLVRDRYRFLEQFATDVAAGRIPLDGRFLARAEGYVLHARQARHLAERVEMQEVQLLTHEQNVLSPGENCESGDRIGCIEATAMGRVPIGTLPDIGTRTCLFHCECLVDYS